VSAAKSNTATATTGIAENPVSRGSECRDYVGRFAPSPSGVLHLGSLFTAAASYLDARAHDGRWLVRIEDLDSPRVVPGSTAGILRTLQAFGFEWDDEVVYQSARIELYAAALESLRARALTFECSCSRSQLADESRYPGLCRDGPLSTGSPTATRLRVEAGRVEFADLIQGRFRQDVAAAVGDVVLRRRDGLFSYVLAVVIDDAAQGVTHVVRGADLLDNTPRQIYLQRLLDLPEPNYSHVPVLTELDGQKLAKSARSVHADARTAVQQLLQIFDLLNLSPPPNLAGASLRDAWQWAHAHWNVQRVPKRISQPLEP
jgi:glutamyl-Q tRNA(Asp) synthetase